jgi:hypothetical protein
MSATENKDSKSSPSSSPKYAFVFTLFLGDGYLPGVLVVTYSLQKTNTVHDIVCMVTPDVSEAARDKMRLMGIIVYPVEYIEYHPSRTLTFRTTKSTRYPQIGKYHTKWNCLKLAQYEKVLMLDVDMLVCRNIDHVFNFNSPAGAVRKVTVDNADVKKYTCLPTGKLIPPEYVYNILYNKNTGISAGCMLLSPDINLYNSFLSFLETFDLSNFRTICGDDEIAIFQFLITRGKQWTALDDKWGCIQWRSCSKCDKTTSFIMDFIGMYKTWMSDLRNYPDTIIWYEYEDELREKRPELFT